MSPSPKVTRIAIIGAALSANKGAAAMAETVVQRMPEFVGACEFSVLTTYPQADAGRLPRDATARLVGLEPWRLAIVETPMAVLVWLARHVRLPLGWVRVRGCRAILGSDVVVDVAGISFAPGRGVPILIYNALMTGLPLLLGVPTVKAAQAMGPFDSQPNRALARLVLPRLSAVCARGKKTREHLDALGVNKVVDVADLAFSLNEAVELPDNVRRTLSAAGEGYVVVMPSSVVRRIFASRAPGGSSTDPYVEAMVELVRFIRSSTGRSVVIAPHSYRVGQPEGRMNDGPVCRQVAESLAGDAGVIAIDADLSAGELRCIIAGAGALVTSRFHAMISGLASCTPTVVVGWSHKYREVLADFGMEGYGMDASALAQPSVVADVVVEVLRNRDSLRRRIASALPAVKERSARNFEVISRVVGENR